MISESQLRSILAPFTDQDTQLQIAETASVFEIKMFASGEERRYLYDKQTEIITDRINNNRKYPGLNALLASESFADLAKMAAAQVRTLERKCSGVPLFPTIHIETTISGVPKDVKLSENFSEFVKALVEPSDIDKIKILLLDGPAGIGKTYFIERLAFEHAQRYLKRENFPPVLHASSRGRRLSRFDDVIAATIQDFKAEGKFYYQQVPILTRTGLLYLAIDGFDELVDSDGYKNAWDLLSNFLRQIEYGGLCILAGRDTFFDQKEFLNRLNANERSLDVIQIHLSEVDQDKAYDWLLSNGWEERSPEVAKKILELETYFLRPYFLTELSQIDDTTYEHIIQVSAKDFLIKKFIEREAKLIGHTLGSPPQDGSKIISKTRDLMTEIAIDMSERESNYIDSEYLSILCEYVFDEIAGLDQIKRLQHKIKTLAFLEKSNYSEDERRFPHEAIQYYFTSIGIIKSILSNHIPIFLRRGIIGTDFLESFVDVLMEEDNINDEDLKEFILNLHSRIRMESSRDRFSPNSVSLLLSTALREPFPLTDPLVLENLHANETYLSGIASSGKIKMSLDYISINRLDARNADLSDIDFISNCSISIFVANSLTKFGSTLPHIDLIYVEGIDKQFLKVYNPDEIHQWLIDRSSVKDKNSTHTLSYKESKIYKIYERVCRLSIKRFLYPKKDRISRNLYESPEWKAIESILKKYQFLEEERTAEVHQLRLKKPTSLLDPKPNSVQEKILEEIKTIAESSDSRK